LLGQDPYIGVGEAVGLSFSCPTKVPPSLRNIYKNLVACGLIRNEPRTGDLTAWASQGILLLNSALTTLVGISGCHKKLWAGYIDGVLTRLAAQKPDLMFILLGSDALSKSNLVSACKQYKWGHPSPLNSVNRDLKNPRNFIHCTAFKLLDTSLRSKGITMDWNPRQTATQAVVPVALPTALPVALPTVVPVALPTVVPTALVPTSTQAATQAATTLTTRRVPTVVKPYVQVPNHTMYIFTDGGCLSNGKKSAKASYAFYILDSAIAVIHADFVPPADLGLAYDASNNRGELMAISSALDYVEKSIDMFNSKYIAIISDSQYSIGCYTKWAPSWIKDPKKLQGKKNLDIILPTIKTIDRLKTKYTFAWKHVYSHKTAPTNPEEMFYWVGNDIADKACQAILASLG